MLPQLLSATLFAVLSPILLGVIAPVQAVAAETGSPPFTLHAGRGDDGSLRLTWNIGEGNYLYRDKIKVVASSLDIPVSIPPGEIKDDVNFGSVEVYHRTLQATVEKSALNGANETLVTFQGCSERGICFPPITRIVDLATLQVRAGSNPAEPMTAEPALTAWEPLPLNEAVTPQPSGFPDFSGLPAGWGMLVLSFLGFGLLLAFTPCVLPMVPILAGILARSREPPSAIRGFALSTTYAVAMASAYAVLGVVAAWSGQNLQIALQTPYALGFTAMVYVALALSSFGLFELRIPSFAPTGASNAPRGTVGSFAGAATLGFTSALIVGPCVTPPLAAALLYVGQTGDVARGATALFALGLGMGLPLILVGIFGSSILPRSGAWLLASRQVFGVLFLGVAALLISRIVPAAISLAIWATLLIGTGIFLGAFDVLRQRASVVVRLRKTGGILAVIYGAALLVGAAAGADDPLRPLVFANSGSIDQRALPVKTIDSPAALDKAMREARNQGRVVMIDYSAEWCTACKTFERSVLADPDIQRRLDRVTIIRADVTATNTDTTDLMRRYDVVGPPTLVFVNPRNGVEIKSARSVGDTSVAEFGRKLDLALR